MRALHRLAPSSVTISDALILLNSDESVERIPMLTAYGEKHKMPNTHTCVYITPYSKIKGVSGCFCGMICNDHILFFSS